jgi:hypothetical protein
VTTLPQRIGKPRQVGAFAGSVDAFKGNEFAHCG